MTTPFRALTLAMLAAVALHGAEADTPTPLAVPLAKAERGFSLIGIDQMDADGVFIAPRGVVARIGERQLIADSARYDLQRGDLFVSGHVVYRQPGIRLTAARLGLHLPPGHLDLADLTAVHGDAWDVEAQVSTTTRNFFVKAERVTISNGKLVFHGVHLTLGRGGIVTFDVPTVEVTLRQPKSGEAASDPRAHVDGVTLISPTGKVVGIPVIWFPYLYRDFAHRYPWSRVRMGHTDTLGTYVRYWIGSDLPAFGGWHTGLEGRVDSQSRVGWGFGLRPYWEHEFFGKGDAQWYTLPDNRGNGSDGTIHPGQQSTTVDAQHQANLGRGGLYGRYTAVPDSAPLSSVPGTPPNYTFLQEYLPERLEHDPFPRQGATGTYTIPGVTTTVDTERRINPTENTTERWVGLQAQVHPLQLIGPLHLGGDTWVEGLHRIYDDTSATRVNSRGYLGAGQWFPGGFGLDADGGVKDLRYTDGIITGSEASAASRWAPFGDAGVKVRLAEDYGLLTHSFVPRIGVQLIGDGQGDTLPAYNFGDGRDTFEEDERYWVAGFDTGLVGSRTLFHATVISRWAMREQDRIYLDSTGVEHLSSSQLADISGIFDGSPVEPLTLNGTISFDALSSTWTRFNTSGRWRLSPFVALKENSALVTTTDSWSHTPGVAFYANRYRLDAATTFRPGGAPVDSWLIEVTRRMVDGDLVVGYENIAASPTNPPDQRLTIGFTLGGAPRGVDQDRPASLTSINP